MTMESNSLREELVECLTQQLSEIDLLQAMYPNPGDIILSDKNIAEITNFVESKTEYAPNNLDFVINLVLDDLKLEVSINLPLSYPNEEPDIKIRCNQLNRQQESSLNMGLTDYLKNNRVGDVCLYTAINWLQDNIDTFTGKDKAGNLQPSNETCGLQADGKFSRIWIYSHHIYDKKKREEILKASKELNISGFCLPGKPGVICIEGEDHACNEWWKVIKSMCWKKLMIRKTETFELSEESEQRRFTNFEELRLKNPTNSKHANMSEFSKFMNQHGFSEVFNDFFGLCHE